ncbi:MAG: sulfotransferase domain-containing protein [Pseudomonadales bacterium]
MGTHVHIVGCSPRSGTTLLHEMMISCYEHDRHYPHERAIHKTPKPEVNETVISKRPTDCIFMDRPMAQNSSLYCIYVLRDPRDVVVSTHGRSLDQYYTSLAWWKFVDQQTRALRANPRTLVVKYEDLTLNPNEVQQRISRVFPFLQQKHPFSEYYLHGDMSEESKLAMKNREQVTTSSIGNWRQHKERLVGQLQLHGNVSEELIDYEYEKNNQWEVEIKGVTGAYFKSVMYRRDRISFFFLIKLFFRKRAYGLRYRFFC